MPVCLLAPEAARPTAAFIRVCSGYTARYEREFIRPIAEFRGVDVANLAVVAELLARLS